jgi:hypothetical protein
MYTVGKNLSPYEGDNNSYVWQHEVGNDQVNLYKAPDQQTKAIPSFFTTPIISYATFNPQKQVAGIDYNIAIERMALLHESVFEYITPYPKIWVYETRIEFALPISNILFNN